MKRSVAILLGIVLFSLESLGQADPVLQHVKSIPGTVADFKVDNLGNIYILDQKGQLKKISPTGDSIAVFNDVRRNGKGYSVDVSNPLKVLLYYKDFGTVVVLDRFLNNRGTIDLRQQNLFQVKAIGQAYDNNIWVFDELESKLKKIGDDGKVIDQSTDFRLIFDSMPSPQFIVDQDKSVYLYDSLKGVFIFDHYGAFKNRVQLRGWTDFIVINNTIYGRDQQFLYKYEPGTLNLRKFRIPPSIQAARRIYITPLHLYVLRDNMLDVFSYR